MLSKLQVLFVLADGGMENPCLTFVTPTLLAVSLVIIPRLAETLPDCLAVYLHSTLCFVALSLSRFEHILFRGHE